MTENMVFWICVAIIFMGFSTCAVFEAQYIRDKRVACIQTPTCDDNFHNKVPQ